MPKLSVITTVFNAEKFLTESLNSLLNQTFQDKEIILVNDGSTDTTDKILEEFSDRHGWPLLKNQYNEGIPYSRNAALQVATGEYIAIHDGDDISLPARLEKEVEYLDSHKDISFIGTHAYKMSENGEILGCMSYPPPDTSSAFYMIMKYKLNPIIDPTSMYRKSIIMEHGGYSQDIYLKTALDFDLWCRFLANGHKLSNLQEPLIKYRINPMGVTRTQNRQMIDATETICARFQRGLLNKTNSEYGEKND